MSIDRWMGKEVVIHVCGTYMMEYYPVIKKNESIHVSWMNLESVIKSKVGQKEKKSCILIRIYGF